MGGDMEMACMHARSIDQSIPNKADYKSLLVPLLFFILLMQLPSPLHLSKQPLISCMCLGAMWGGSSRWWLPWSS